MRDSTANSPNYLEILSMECALFLNYKLEGIPFLNCYHLFFKKSKDFKLYDILNGVADVQNIPENLRKPTKCYNVNQAAS